jgi:hypothetical protein
VEAADAVGKRVVVVVVVIIVTVATAVGFLTTIFVSAAW